MGSGLFGMGPGYFGYMAEAEGQDDLIDTPDAQFNAAVNQMRSELAWAKNDSNYDATADVNDILRQHGISPSQLTKSQINRIKRTIA